MERRNGGSVARYTVKMVLNFDAADEAAAQVFLDSIEDALTTAGVISEDYQAAIVGPVEA